MEKDLRRFEQFLAKVLSEASLVTKRQKQVSRLALTELLKIRNWFHVSLKTSEV